jgi:hypothetical protein
MSICYILSRFGMLYQEKSGSPGTHVVGRLENCFANKKLLWEKNLIVIQDGLQ